MSIEGIFLSPVASGPMQSVAQATLIANRGLEGDRYCDNVGTYSVLRISKSRPGEREPGRQLTMLSADSVEEALDRNGLPQPPSLGNLRRNLVVRGMTAADLLAAAGHVVQLGDSCRILIHRNCVPCMYNERKNGIPGLMEALWNDAGVSCQVLQGGRIAVGDAVVILEELMDTDEGHQSPGFFVRPSQRTAAMVRSALAKSRLAKAELLELDREGVERVQASYSSVGLTFWPRDKE